MLLTFPRAAEDTEAPETEVSELKSGYDYESSDISKIIFSIIED